MKFRNFTIRHLLGLVLIFAILLALDHRVNLLALELSDPTLSPPADIGSVQRSIILEGPAVTSATDLTTVLDRLTLRRRIAINYYYITDFDSYYRAVGIGEITDNFSTSKCKVEGRAVFMIKLTGVYFEEAEESYPQ